MSKPRPQEERAKILAKELAYGIAAWRGRSPEFMTTMVRRWTSKLVEFAQKEVLIEAST